MPQEYELTQFKVGDFKDANQNTWCDAVFQGMGEPVKWVVKDPNTITVGQKYYGTIKQRESQAGKTYLRFYREKKPDQQSGGSGYGKGTYQPRDDMAIRAQWAIGQAVSSQVALRAATGTTMPALKFDEVEVAAKLLYAMVDRVKNTTVVTDTKPVENTPDWAPAEIRQRFSKTER